MFGAGARRGKQSAGFGSLIIFPLVEPDLADGTNHRNGAVKAKWLISQGAAI